VSEQFRNRGKKPQLSGCASQFTKAMVAAWGESSEEEDSSQDEAEVLAIMAKSDSDTDSESDETMSQIKEKVSGFNKRKILKILFSIMDEYEAMNTKNCMLKDTCSKLKRDVRMLEKTILELEQANEVLTAKRDEETFTLRKNLDQMNKREEVLNTELSKLESESRELESKTKLLESENNKLLRKLQKTESELVQNRLRNSTKNSQLQEKLQKNESDLIENRRWNSFSEAVNWLNTHHSRNKRGLGFVSRRVTKLVSKKYIGLPKNIICFHYGKTGHHRYACPIRKKAMERNSTYVKKIWIKEDELISMSKGMGSGFGFPRLTLSCFAG